MFSGTCARRSTHVLMDSFLCSTGHCVWHLGHIDEGDLVPALKQPWEGKIREPTIITHVQVLGKQG